MIALQQSLFPQKGDFNPVEFQNKCLTSEFISCLQRGAPKAMRSLNRFLQEPVCTRNKSSLLHEYMGRSIKEEIETHMANHDIACYIDPAGNKRDVIFYNGYTFIFRKNLRQRNESIISEQIDSQVLDSHVITINYDTDPFWTSIISLNLLYIENNVVLYSFPIGVLQDSPVFEVTVPSQPEIEKAQPTIKKDKVKHKMELA